MGKWGWIVASLLFLNLVILDVWVFGKLGREEAVLGDRVEKVIEKEIVEADESVSWCDEDCVGKIVDEKIESMVGKYGLVVKEPVKSVPKIINKVTVVPEVEKFIRVSGGDGQGSGWIRLGATVFWLDTVLYGELVEATWEGWLDSTGGKVDGWVRLYDASNGRVVDGSEMRVVATDKTSFYSSSISIWRGQNQYYIEIKDDGGNKLTVSEPRLRLVVK